MFFAVSETTIYSILIVNNKMFVYLIDFQWMSVSAIFIKNFVIDFWFFVLTA